MRIVSLLPSATEIVAALGFQSNLVGRSHECDFPPGVKDLPVVTSPQLKVEASSGQIDREVKALLEKGLAIYRVDVEQLKALRPDILVTQSQCEVCAVSEAELEKALQDWVGGRPKIVSLKPNSLADVWLDIQRVADQLGVSERGRKLVQGLREMMAQVSEKASLSDVRPTIACLEWMDPLMAAGNWMPELVELAGGQNLFGRAGEHSPWMSWEELKRANPEVIVVLPCGFDIHRTRREIHVLQSHHGWEELQAVRQHRVYLTDGNQYFNRPGPRLVDSLEILAEILHPANCDYGHRNKGWEIL